jgi:hypothetical protein
VIESLEPVVEVGERPDPKIDLGAANYVRSFLIMRANIGLLGVALPILLVFVDRGAFSASLFPRNSLSAYYYSGMREVFVVTLAATGFFLIAYKVTERNLDNTLSFFAGVCAVLIALFPTSRPSHSIIQLTPLQHLLSEKWVTRIHFTASALFIIALGVISYYFGKREGDRPERVGTRPPRFWQSYHFACAAAIGVALIWIVVARFAGGPRWSLLLGETVAALAFGLSWFWKGLEIDTILNKPAPTASPTSEVLEHALQEQGLQPTLTRSRARS